MVLGSRSLVRTKTSKLSSHFNLRNELHDYTVRFNYFRILPSTFDELVSLVGIFLVRKGAFHLFSFLLAS